MGGRGVFILLVPKENEALRVIVSTAICWISGLLVAFERDNLEVMLCVAAMTVAVVGLFVGNRNWKAAVLSAGVLLLAVLYGGWQHARNATPLPESGLVELRGVIHSPVEIDGDRIRFVWKGNGGPAVRAAVIVKVNSKYESETAKRWRRGDHVKLRGEIAVPSGARNFGQFDYAAYLA